MVENGEPAGSVTAPWAVAPSCYRVSVVSGSLEVSARLKNADDLELLMRVLEANKVLFTKAEEPAALENEDRSKSKSSAKTDRSQTDVKADRPTLHLSPNVVAHASR
jgi:hypothetical protein